MLRDQYAGSTASTAVRVTPLPRAGRGTETSRGMLGVVAGWRGRPSARCRRASCGTAHALQVWSGLYVVRTATAVCDQDPVAPLQGVHQHQGQCAAEEWRSLQSDRGSFGDSPGCVSLAAESLPPYAPQSVPSSLPAPAVRLRGSELGLPVPSAAHGSPPSDPGHRPDWAAELVGEAVDGPGRAGVLQNRLRRQARSRAAHMVTRSVLDNAQAPRVNAPCGQ